MTGDSTDARSIPVAVDSARSPSRGANGQRVRTLSKGVVGFVGLGRMGTAMAANLVAAGRSVVAHMRHPERLSELKALGITSTTNIADLFDCEFVVSMLPNDDSVREVVFGRNQSGLDGLALGLVPGAIHISMSTISTRATSQLAAEHARRSQGYVAAPVFGNPDAARACEIYIITAGASVDVERCLPLFDILGQQTFLVGSEPSAANLIKLAGNMMTATTLEVLGEVIALIRKHGLNPETFVDILTATMFGGRVHRIYGGKIAAQTYAAPGFVLPLALKTYA
jgi:3-hydroxyisobutyrate dehydrogenase-like beta-hydroxyacid dehydrogenase